jgi:hypothetical protein
MLMLAATCLHAGYICIHELVVDFGRYVQLIIGVIITNVAQHRKHSRCQHMKLLMESNLVYSDLANHAVKYKSSVEHIPHACAIGVDTFLWLLWL